MTSSITAVGQVSASSKRAADLSEELKELLLKGLEVRVCTSLMLVLRLLWVSIPGFVPCPHVLRSPLPNSHTPSVLHALVLRLCPFSSAPLNAQAREFDRNSIDAIISELTTIGSKAFLSSGPWQAVYTKNSQPLWEKQAKYIPIVKNRAWQVCHFKEGERERFPLLSSRNVS